VAAFLAKHYGGVVGSPLPEPIGTVTSVDHHSLVSAHLIDAAHPQRDRAAAHRDGGRTATARSWRRSWPSCAAPARASAAVDAPLHTISAGGTHHAEVRALLMKYYGTDQDPQLREPLHTVTTKDRFGLVTVKGEVYAIADIGMRMLQPRELYRAQGFPDTYVIERGHDGRQLSKADQVRMCGNSVCPPLARVIVAASCARRSRWPASRASPWSPRRCTLPLPAPARHRALGGAGRQPGGLREVRPRQVGHAVRVAAPDHRRRRRPGPDRVPAGRAAGADSRRRDAGRAAGVHPLRGGDRAGQAFYITNYETVRDGKLDPALFTAVSLDEASVLRSFGSKTYQEFLPLFEGCASSWSTPPRRAPTASRS
jgi:hypothetical protein